jgi:gliding motility-associated-like protein
MYAQTAQFDARLLLKRIDCPNQRAYLELQVRASDTTAKFLMGDANFRLRYDSRIIGQPFLMEQMKFSSVAPASDRNYAEQNLQGSAEGPTVGLISLNLIYTGAANTATRVDTVWQTVSLLGFQLVRATSCFDLIWNNHQTFPATGMNSVNIPASAPSNYSLTDVAASGVFENVSVCPRTICDSYFPPVAVKDTGRTIRNTKKIIGVTSNDTTRGGTIRVMTPPTNGTAIRIDSGSVEYVPNPGFCGIDSLEYEICNLVGCDTAWAVINVSCEDFEIFTGVSPNDDGINDTFIIIGIERFPDNVLKIYNRWGNMVYEKQGYKNEWSGSWDGYAVPDGTYYYILEDGKGKTYTGYLQIQR